MTEDEQDPDHAFNEAMYTVIYATRAAWQTAGCLRDALISMDTGMAKIPQRGLPEIEMEFLIERAMLFQRYDLYGLALVDLLAAVRLARTGTDGMQMSVDVFEGALSRVAVLAQSRPDGR